MPKLNPTRVAAKFEREVGKRIKEQREASEMSQTSLGERLGVSFQQVQKYENGTNRMSAYRLMLAAEALGVDIRFFYGLIKQKKAA